jgi:hypothetical protein
MSREPSESPSGSRKRIFTKKSMDSHSPKELSSPFEIPSAKSNAEQRLDNISSVIKDKDLNMSYVTGLFFETYADLEDKIVEEENLSKIFPKGSREKAKFQNLKTWGDLGLELCKLSDLFVRYLSKQSAKNLFTIRDSLDNESIQNNINSKISVINNFKEAFNSYKEFYKVKNAPLTIAEKITEDRIKANFERTKKIFGDTFPLNSTDSRKTSIGHDALEGTLNDIERFLIKIDRQVTAQKTSYTNLKEEVSKKINLFSDLQSIELEGTKMITSAPPSAPSSAPASTSSSPKPAWRARANIGHRGVQISPQHREDFLKKIGSSQEQSGSTSTPAYSSYSPDYSSGKISSGDTGSFERASSSPSREPKIPLNIKSRFHIPLQPLPTPGSFVEKVSPGKTANISLEPETERSESKSRKNSSGQKPDYDHYYINDSGSSSDSPPFRR